MGLIGKQGRQQDRRREGARVPKGAKRVYDVDPRRDPLQEAFPDQSRDDPSGGGSEESLEFITRDTKPAFTLPPRKEGGLLARQVKLIVTHTTILHGSP